MIYNDKRQVPFEDDLNRFIRTEVSQNPYLLDRSFKRKSKIKKNFFRKRGPQCLLSLSVCVCVRASVCPRPVSNIFCVGGYIAKNSQKN